MDCGVHSGGLQLMLGSTNNARSAVGGRRWLVRCVSTGLAPFLCISFLCWLLPPTAPGETDMTQKTELPAPFEPPKPGLEFLARFEVNLDAPILEVGEVEGVGKRRIIPITGGEFSGPRIKGQILNNGADWQVVQADGLAKLDTRYALKTDDGALIYIQTRGVRYGPKDVIAEVAKGNPVDPKKYFFRVFVQFETSAAQYHWLNRAMAIGSGMRLRNAVIYDAYLIQ